MLTADGLDTAFLGVSSNGLAVYDIDKILGILTERDGMALDEAWEFFEFNIAGSLFGDETPIYMERMSLDEYKESGVD